jgi:8-oxo-dGTP diphosphatase
MKNKGPIKVVGMILLKDGKLLLAKRPMNKQFGGFWELPGGKVELNESYPEALRREISEELSIELGELAYYDSNIYPISEHEQINLICFLCYHYNGEIKLTEHLEAKWFTKNDLTKINMAPADVKIIDSLKLSQNENLDWDD